MREEEEEAQPIGAAALFVRKWFRLNPKQRRRFERLAKKHLGRHWPTTCNARQQLYLVDSALSGLEPSPRTLRGLAIDGQAESPARYPPEDGWRA